MTLHLGRVMAVSGVNVDNDWVGLLGVDRVKDTEVVAAAVIVIAEVH